MNDKQIDNEAFRVLTIDGEAVDFSKLKEEILLLAEKKGVPRKDIVVDKSEAFTADAATLILLGFLSQVAYDIWKDYIWPTLKEKYIFKKPGSD